MDGDEVKESASDGASGASSAMCLDASCEHESTQPAKKQLRRKRASSELGIVSLSGKLAGKDTTNPRINQNRSSVNDVELLNLDENCSFVEDSKQKNDADITKMDSESKEQALQVTRKAVKEQQMMAKQIDEDYKNKDREPKHVKEKTEREAKHIERENKQLKKHQEEAEREKKRKVKEQAELKRQASIKKQASFMERLFIRKPNNHIESTGSHCMEKTTCQPSGIIEESPVAATSAMDCTLSQAKNLRAEEYWVAHVCRWRKLSQCNRLQHWGVRRSPTVQLFPEPRLQKSSTAASNNISTPTKELASEESTGGLDFTKLLDELKTASREKNSQSRTPRNSISSSVFLVKKLLQFDRSFRPAYYGTWRKKSSTVSSRQPFQRDPQLNYDIESDEEWEEEDSGERLSDFEEDDKADSEIDVEEETDNSFVVPDDHLSEDKGLKVTVKSDESSSTQFLRRATEDALSTDRPVVISNLDHSKLDLLKAEDITAEKLCLQALCMERYPSGPIIDVPVDVKVTMKDQEFCQSDKKIPRTLVPSKSLSVSDSDMPEFAKLVKSCSHGMGKLVDLLHERFPCISKAQLKNKVREIAEYTHNRWQVKKDILDKYSLCLSPDKSGSSNCESHFPQQCQPPDESGKTGESSRHSTLRPDVSRQQISAQGSSGSAPQPDP